MSKLLSVLALAGNKDAALLAAVDDVRDALLYAVRDGNTRNLNDTAQALRDAGAVRKDGAPAANKRGAVLTCLLTAIHAAHSAREAFTLRHAGHKGKPCAAMTADAGAAADTIAAAFEEQVTAAIAPKPKATKPVDAAPTLDAAATVEKITLTEPETAQIDVDADVFDALTAALTNAGHDAVLTALLALAVPQRMAA